MFTTLVPQVSYSDPWIAPLHNRLKALCRSNIRVAYYYEEPNNSTFRYRAYNMAQVLNETPNSNVSASYFFETDLEYFFEIAEYADILVICRSRYSSTIQKLVSKFRALGKKILFDVDDLVFDTRYTHLLLTTLNLNTSDNHVLDSWYSMTARMGEALRLCDGAITTNSFLAQKIKDFHNLPVFVIPNFINREQQEISDRIYASKCASNFERTESIHMGYFSGSPSHSLDFALLETSLVSLLSQKLNLKLVIAGYIEPSKALKSFKDRIIYHPFQDYINLQRLIGSVELNLIPLQINNFTNCKSELKFFEAAIVGTISLASPSYTYKTAINNGENGFISMAHEWETNIAACIEDFYQYPKIATAGYNYSLKNYSWTNQYDTILKALGLAK
jgi:glycosyltransferase involved in cell wall biosynthesis